MGEAFLGKFAGDQFQAFSAGTSPRNEIFPPVVEAMREIGIDISDRKPKGIKEFLGRTHFDKVIIVCANAEKNCPAIFGPSQRLFWPFDDPAAVQGSHDEILQATRRIRDEISTRIIDWLKSQSITPGT